MSETQVETQISGKMSSPSHAEENFQYSVRLFNTNIKGTDNIVVALTSIHGIGRSISTIICSTAEVDPTKRAGELTADELRLIVAIVQNPARYNLPSFYFNRQVSLGSNHSHILGALPPARRFYR